MKLPTLSLHNKTAVVTGCNQGLGAGLASAMATAGANVVLVDCNVSRLDALAADIESMGSRAIICATDISLEESVSEMVEQALSAFGSIEVLVNNAGVAGPTAPVQDIAPEEQSGEEPSRQTGQEINEAVSSPPPDLITTNNDDPIKVNAQPDSESTEAGLSVAIEDFKLSVKSSNNSIRVRFKLRNTSSDSQHVSGHAIVVLKGENIQENQWVSLPGISLIGGKPTGRQKGNAFGIKNFKIIDKHTGIFRGRAYELVF